MWWVRFKCEIVWVGPWGAAEVHPGLLEEDRCGGSGVRSQCEMVWDEVQLKIILSSLNKSDVVSQPGASVK